MNSLSTTRKSIFLSIIIMFILSLAFACDDSGTAGLSGSNGTNGQDGQDGQDGQLNITEDTTWETGQTYVIQRSIVVKDGVTLTIQPGAIVSLNPYICIYIDGTLNAQGTFSQHIIVKNEGTIGGGSFYLTATSDNNNLMYIEFHNNGLSVDSSAAISYCDFTQEESAHAYSTLSINSSSTGVTLSNCTINGVGNSSSGVSVAGAGPVGISDCTINNASYGFNISNTGIVEISNCSITNIVNQGFIISNSGAIEISDCIITDVGSGFLAYNSSSSVIIQDSQFANCAGSGICCTGNGSPVFNIQNASITNCAGSGIYCTSNGSGMLDIQNTSIANCQSYGVYSYNTNHLSLNNSRITSCQNGIYSYCYLDQENEIIIQDGTISDCIARGVHIDGYTTLSTTNSIINNCQDGIYFDLEGASSIVTLSSSSITNNTRYGIYINDCSRGISINNSNLFGNETYDFYNNTDMGHNARSNWWGFTAANLIDFRIYDYHDDDYYGDVDYSSYLSSEVAVTGYTE